MVTETSHKCHAFVRKKIADKKMTLIFLKNLTAFKKRLHFTNELMGMETKLRVYETEKTHTGS